MITTALLPSSTVCNPNMIPILLMENICYNIFMKYLHKLTKSVETRIKERLPGKFCLVLSDGLFKRQILLPYLQHTVPIISRATYVAFWASDRLRMKQRSVPTIYTNTSYSLCHFKAKHEITLSQLLVTIVVSKNHLHQSCSVFSRLQKFK